MKKKKLVALLCLLVGTLASVALAAYHHAGEQDAPNFLQVYPSKAGTKLDNCALCHSGGKVTSSSGKTTTYGSCQWCHYKYGYDNSGDITATLNPYGKAYLAKGRSAAALTSIENLDSDGDGYSNIAEINAIRYPGDATDDPSKVIAPYRIFTKKQLQAMPQHKQFMLMNTSKSGDYYVEYSGVIMQDLLTKAGITAAATKITVYSPDGYSTGHPLADSDSNTGKSYAPYVNGIYPPATYFYNYEADKKINTSYGWCDYSSPGNSGRKHGDAIKVNNGLRMLLALQADGTDLVPGELGPDNKLKSNSEGPFRTVTPQKFVGPPDQPSTDPKHCELWQYDFNFDHNAGFSSKSATIIKVEPLPEGSTDINVLEAGWEYVGSEKIVIYGALQGPVMVSPINGASTPVNGTILIWQKYADPDPSATMSYTVEISKDKKTWTPVSTKSASVTTTKNSMFAGAGKFMLFGLIGSIAVVVPRRSRKYLGLVLLIAVAGTVLSSCGGGHSSYTSSTDSSGDTTSNQSLTAAINTALTIWGSNKESLTVPPGTLEANTTYYWRVTADSANSHAISEVATFKTTQ